MKNKREINSLPQCKLFKMNVKTIDFFIIKNNQAVSYNCADCMPILVIYPSLNTTIVSLILSNCIQRSTVKQEQNIFVNS